MVLKLQAVMQQYGVLMKSKEQKYEEAVVRNLKTFGIKSKHKYMTLTQMKHCVGIRQSNTRFDHLWSGNI